MCISVACLCVFVHEHVMETEGGGCTCVSGESVRSGCIRCLSLTIEVLWKQATSCTCSVT